jgi:hypothetical protein
LGLLRDHSGLVELLEMNPTRLQGSLKAAALMLWLAESREIDLDP